MPDSLTPVEQLIQDIRDYTEPGTMTTLELHGKALLLAKVVEELLNDILPGACNAVSECLKDEVDCGIDAVNLISDGRYDPDA